jgi:hypothetical protein
MLGGEAITDSLRASAREMLEERSSQEAKGESERAKGKASRRDPEAEPQGIRRTQRTPRS